MTDTYGTEPHDHDNEHGEPLSSEHGGVSEPPSDYEFADDSGATADVEHTEEQALPSDEQPARRSPMLPIAAAVGGILVLGAVAWWQFGSSAPPAGSVAPLSTMTTASLNITPPSNVAKASHVAEAPAPAAPALPVTPKVALTEPVDVADASSSPALPPSDGIRQAVPTAPVSAAMPAVTAPSSAPGMPGTLPMPATASMGGGADQRIDELNTRIDSLQKALDQANQQLGQVTNMVAANASPSSSSIAGAPPVAKDVQDRLDKLEQQLAELQHPAPGLSAPPSSSAAPLSVENVVAPSKTVSHTSKHKAVHKVAHKPVRKAPVAKPGPQWVLRAATPGQAWVADSATSHDLKQLQVGDQLAGIGRVTAIQQQDGNWVVQGTKGKIQ